MHGIGMMEYSNNNIYIGEFVRGKIDGFGQFYFCSGNTYIGNYEAGLKSGFGIFISQSTPLNALIGFFDRGKLHGVNLKIKNGYINCFNKRRDKDEKMIKVFELNKYLNSSEYKYKGFFEKKPAWIINFVKKYSSRDDVFIDEIDEIGTKVNKM